jgi:hypothetical protein
MSTTASPSVGSPGASWSRWAPLSGIVAIVLMVVAFLVSGSSPDTSDPDAKILSYLASDSNQTQNIAALFIFFAGVLFLLGFFAALRSRLRAQGEDHGILGTLAYGSGFVSAALWMGAVIFFVAPLLAASDAPSVDQASMATTYRVANDAGYAFWVAAVGLGALVVGATSIIAFRNRSLPRWFVWAGFVVAVLCLLGVFFIPAFVYWAWIVVLAILLVRPVGADPAAVQVRGA